MKPKYYFALFVFGAGLAGAGFVAGKNHAERAARAFYDQATAKLEATSARHAANFLYGGFGHRSAVAYFQFACDIWIASAFYGAKPDSVRKRLLEENADVVAAHLCDETAFSEFFKRMPVDKEKHETALRELVEIGKRKIAEQKAHPPRASDLFSANLEGFSYEKFIATANENLRLYGNPFSVENVTRGLYFQYETAGRTTPDARGFYTQYFLLPQNRVLDFPANAAGEAVGDLTLYPIEKLTIDSGGYWHVEKNQEK